MRLLLSIIFLFGLTSQVPGSDPPALEITDAMSDDELRAWKEKKVAELQELRKKTPPEKTPEGTVHRTLYCTVYYTPKESGFTAEKGFDVTPTTAPGLGGRTYAKSFLRAVRMEGFGRISEPVRGLNYVRYAGRGRYAYAKAPLGNRGNVLVPRQSCAISRKNPILRQGQKIRIKSALVEQVTGSTEWVISDTGGGVHPLQIDLYWGEDEPRGSQGRAQARPAGTKLEYAFDIEVVAEN